MRFPITIPLTLLLPLTSAVEIFYRNTNITCDFAYPPSNATLSIAPAIIDNHTTLYHTITPFRPIVNTSLTPSQQNRNCLMYTMISFSEPGWRVVLNFWVGRVRGNFPIAKGERGMITGGFEWPNMGDTYVSGVLTIFFLALYSCSLLVYDFFTQLNIISGYTGVPSNLP